MAIKNTAWIAFALGLAVAPMIATAEAASKPPPTCVAIYYQRLPPGTTGAHQVGMYNSPSARLELRGDGLNYYMLIGGKRIYEGDVPVSMMGTATHQGYRLPAAAAKCLAAKNMPKPQCKTNAVPSMQGMCLGDCQGESLMLVVARAGNQRLALLYLKNDNGWGFCSAGAF